MKKSRDIILTVMSLVASVTTAFAGEQVGTITNVEGEVKLFTHPGKNIAGPAPHALFEGEYYSVQNAKVGDKVERGNVLRTAPNAKARIIYENGDQFNVGGGTAYRMKWDKDSATAKTDISLMYGKLRGVVAKGGPRSKLVIRTKTATMGVRGTDFFIADNSGTGPNAGTEVSIIRGEVAVTPKAAEGKKAEVVAVKAGYSVEVAAPPPPPAPKAETKGEVAKEGVKAEPVKEVIAEAPKVELRKTTQEDLSAIQKSSAVKVEPKKEVAQMTEQEKVVAEKLEVLEKKAVVTTLNDIKTHDPKMYAQLDQKAITNTLDLNNKAVETLAKEAPKAPTPRKPFKSEMEDLEGDAYKKYFKIVD